MGQPTLRTRVQVLDEQMDALKALPARVAAVEEQIVQLHGEMVQLRGEMCAGFAEVRQEFVAVRQEIREGDEATRRYMRVLHEEVLTRIATLAEGRHPG
jgi:hypothetical protein